MLKVVNKQQARIEMTDKNLTNGLIRKSVQSVQRFNQRFVPTHEETVHCTVTILRISENVCAETEIRI